LEKLAMKKSLIALAALAATASFAQSSVTLSGVIDFAAANVGGTQPWAKGSTVSTTVGNSATSVIRIAAVEDLGGGMKATAFYALDPRTFANDNLAVTNNTGVVTNTGSQACSLAVANNATAIPAATTSSACVLGTVGGQANTTTGMARDEAYVALEGGFGNVKLGSPNSIGLTSFLSSSPLGTGVGSGYGLAGTFSNVRYNRSARYDTPVMNGFSASVLFAPGNDQTATVTAPTTSASTGAVTPAVPVANFIPNARKVTELSLRYANGPLSVSYVNIAQGEQTNATGWYANGTSTKAKKTSANILDASYNFGSTTVYAGWNDGDRLAPLGTAGADPLAAVESKGYRVALKQNLGAIDLIAQYSQQEALGVKSIATAQGVTTISTGVLKAKVTGLRADYNLSKTAALYLGYEKYDTGVAYSASSPATTGERTITSLGLRKSF
jgi:predicted porin